MGLGTSDPWAARAGLIFDTPCERTGSSQAKPHERISSELKGGRSDCNFVLFLAADSSPECCPSFLKCVLIYLLCKGCWYMGEGCWVYILDTSTCTTAHGRADALLSSWTGISHYWRVLQHCGPLYCCYATGRWDVHLALYFDSNLRPWSHSQWVNVTKMAPRFTFLSFTEQQFKNLSELKAATGPAHLHYF